MGKAVVCIGDPGCQLRGPRDYLLSVLDAPQLQQYRGQESMPGKADLRSGDRALGENQRLLETTGLQQPVGLTGGGRSGGGHGSGTVACPSSRHADATQ